MEDLSKSKYESKLRGLISDLIQSGEIAVKELVKVAREPIIKEDEDISAEKLKNAAAAKRLAIEDGFAIISKIREEESKLNSANDDSSKEEDKKPVKKQGWAERNAN